MKTITYLKKNNASVLLMLFLLFSLKAISQEYCSPQFNSWASLTCDNYRLREVAIGDINNDATSADCLVSDYLTLSTTHQAGETVDFSITLGNWMSFAIYADFNLDGDFDDMGEMLYAGNPEWVVAVETVADSFTLPSDVTVGDYRMRVVAIWGDSAENPPITEGQACETFNREGSGNYHDYTLTIGEATATPVTAPVTITSGFNHDIIANGIGNASASSDIGFDEVNSRALVSLDFQATSGSGFPTYGLPADGLIASALTPDVTFQLADYSGDNALFLTPDYVGTGTSTGTLEMSVQNPNNLYLLTATAGGGVQYLSLDVTVNFDDSTTQDATVSVSDWYNGTGAAIQGMGRVNRANNNLEGDATNPRLYEYTIAIDEANQNKTITSLSFSFDGDQTAEWGSEIRLSLLAVSAQSTESVQSGECVFTPLQLQDLIMML